MCTPLRKSVAADRYMFPVAATVILLDGEWIAER
jgi:hypothetical protein